MRKGAACEDARGQVSRRGSSQHNSPEGLIAEKQKSQNFNQSAQLLSYVFSYSYML